MVKALHLHFVGIRLVIFRRSDERARTFDDEGAVHHEERLLRHCGDEALRAALIRRGKVERAENPG